MEKRTWNIGVIGAGGISDHHLEACRLEPRVSVKAIADISRAYAQLRAERFSIPAIYEDYRDMLAQEELDAVVICVPNFLHAPAALDALAAGKHVLCEKPLALTASQAQEMADAARRAGNVLMVGQNNRFRSTARKLKQLVEEGRLGRIYHAKTGWVRRNGIPGWGSWFTRHDRAGGGPLIDIGVHMLDLTLWLLGFPEPTYVFGQTYAEFGPRKKGLSGWGTFVPEGVYDVEDMATALIRFTDGSTLSLDVSWAAHIREERAWVQLYGTEGGAVIDFDRDEIALFHEVAGAPCDSVISVPEENARLLLWQNFVDALEGRAQPVCLPEQAVLVNRLLDSIYRSSKTGEPVKLAETAAGHG